MRYVLAALLLAGCAGYTPGAMQPVTMSEIRLVMYAAGIGLALEPAEMTDREKQIVVGFCLAQRRVQTQFDAVAAAYCADAEAALLAPVVPPAT